MELIDTRRGRDPWRAVWDAAIGDWPLVVLLALAAVLLAVAAAVPQIGTTDPIAQAQALSSLRVQYGGWARGMEAVGLHSVIRSWGFRVVLALILCSVCLRAIEIGWRLRLHRPWASTAPDSPSPSGAQAAADGIALVAHLGAILTIVGLAITQAWGWEVTEVVLHGGDPVEIAASGAWVAADEAGHVTASALVRTRDEIIQPGARVRALGADGRHLVLQRSPGSAATEELTLALPSGRDLQTRDALFTVPGANLIVRLAPGEGPGPNPSGSLLVQVYRSRSGELTAEAVLRGGGDVRVEDVELSFDSAAYTALTAAYNPGLWPTVVGLVGVFLGVGASIGRHAVAGLRNRGLVGETGQDGPAQ